MEAIEIGDISYYYIDTGNGEPLVLLGGTIGTAKSDFSNQIESFCTDYRVIAPERRGYGHTRPPNRDYPDDFYQRDAKDMAAFIKALNLGPATVFGWSEGADVALCLGALYPEAVSRLVVWGGLAEVTADDIEIFEARRDVSLWPVKVCDALTEAYGETYWQTTWWKWCDVMVRLYGQGGDVRLAPIEQISCATLVIHGTEDPLVRKNHAVTIHNRIQGSVLKIMDGCGHSPHITHTEDFHNLVREFIND